MTVSVLQNRLDAYQCKNSLDEQNAMKEMTQEVILMALSRANFFKLAEFHGGTALRILYGLPRFSEDLDFALLQPENSFDWKIYFNKISDELMSFGYDVEMVDRSKADSAVKKAFLKDDSVGKVLNLQYHKADRSQKKIRIKLELDVNPPAGSENEMKYLDFPMPFSIYAQKLSSSFAGKLHALLCRTYVKGRDWYDFSWYIMRGTQINYGYLEYALNQLGPWQGEDISVDKAWLLTALKEKVQEIDWGVARQDVQRFIQPGEQPSLELWGADFFNSRLQKLDAYLD